MAGHSTSPTSIRNSQDNYVSSRTSESMSRRIACRKTTITKIPGESIRRSTTLNNCYVEGDRTTSTSRDGSESNVASRKRKVDYHDTRANHYDMAGCRVE